MQPKILICDDDRDIIDVTTMVLVREGYSVFTINSCKNIIEETLKVKPDVILMDLRIPDYGGDLGIKMLKESPETKNIPVLIFSAVNDLSKKVELLNADGYIEKPYSIDELVSRIKMAINISASVD